MVLKDFIPALFVSDLTNVEWVGRSSRKYAVEWISTYYEKMYEKQHTEMAEKANPTAVTSVFVFAGRVIIIVFG